MQQFFDNFPDFERFDLKLPSTEDGIEERMLEIEEVLLPLAPMEPALHCERTFLTAAGVLIEQGGFSLDDLRTYPVVEIIRLSAAFQVLKQLRAAFYGPNGNTAAELDHISGRLREQLLEALKPIEGAPTTKEFAA